MNADIVVSAELNLYPDVERKVASFFDELAPEGSRYKYVNSGTVIGYAGALEAMYARLLDDDLKYLRPESPERSHEVRGRGQRRSWRTAGRTNG